MVVVDVGVDVVVVVWAGSCGATTVVVCAGGGLTVVWEQPVTNARVAQATEARIIFFMGMLWVGIL